MFVAKRSEHEKTFFTSFNLNLTRLFHHDFGLIPKTLDGPGNANLFSRKQHFWWFLEFTSVRPPNQRCEHLIGIRFIEVQKGRLPLAASGIMCTGDRAADRLG